MVHTSTLKEMGFESMEEYFGYIVDSEYNGQPQQVKDLIKQLSKPQKKDFLDWLEVAHGEMLFVPGSEEHNLRSKTIQMF